MFDQFEVVVALKRLSDNVPAGTSGTILDVYLNPTGYEVEFTDENHDTIELLAVMESDNALRKEFE